VAGHPSGGGTVGVGEGVGEGVGVGEDWAETGKGVKKLTLRNKRKRVVDIDNARTHIREREEQRMRGERIIDIAVCVARSLPVAPLAHFETRASTNDRERGSAAGAAPAAGDPKHAT
jgi:hypothetical protein